MRHLTEQRRPGSSQRRSSSRQRWPEQPTGSSQRRPGTAHRWNQTVHQEDQETLEKENRPTPPRRWLQMLLDSP
jgi:hypothetical protein